MGEIKTSRDLEAWKKSFELGLAIYEVTRSFPADERFGLTMQLRRGSVSVMSNIAEGFGRGSLKDYERFVRVSRGGLYEIDSQLSFARRLSFLDERTHAQLQMQIDECGRLISGLLRSLQRRQ